MARRSKLQLDPTLRKRLLDAAATNASLTDIAAFCGISVDTLDRYRKDPSFGPEFARAEAAPVLSASLSIRRSWESGDWRAGAWYLERRRPADWGKRDSLDVNQKGTVEHTHRYDWDRLSTEEIEQWRAYAVKAQREEDTGSE
jgi:hypothetical protein